MTLEPDLLRGIDVKIYDGEQYEIAQNILVGEPSHTPSQSAENTGSLLSYTLGIPKADTHQWENKRVDFFGRSFRTTGFAIQGIDGLIPGKHNKKITAELMETNGSITIFSSGNFEKIKLEKVLVSDERGISCEKTAEKVSGDLICRIYSPLNSGYIPKLGDLIIPEIVADTVDNSSQQTVSQSVSEIRTNHPNFAVVQSVEKVICGSFADYILRCR